MVSTSGRPRSQAGGSLTKSWLLWTLLLLHSTKLTAADTTRHLEPQRNDQILASRDKPPLQPTPQSLAGRSPAEIPLLQHDIPTAKFRSTNDDIEYQALAPALNHERSAVRAPIAQPVELPSSGSLSQLDTARSLSNWEVDDIILISTIDGALHARDRRSGRQRWTIQPGSPMIETTHYKQNKSDLELDYDVPTQEEQLFIVEPTGDGQLYAQYADPRIGLQKLPVTVRKMASRTPLSMNLGGQYLTTTSEVQTKSYTIDAESGEILFEFPRSRSAMKLPEQKRCPPRGFGFEDVACKTGRTMRVGRNTYTFTISNEQTGQDMCTIRYSEWVTNQLDHDLQAQYRTSFDGYDLRIFHDGWIMGIERGEEGSYQHRYRQLMDSPVARVYDVVRPEDSPEDESADLVILSRPSDHLAGRLVDSAMAEAVFVNKTDDGQWYALSEASYPGVTARALPARVTQSHHVEYLDLYGELKEIVGVHTLSAAQSTRSSPQGQLTINAPPEPPGLPQTEEALVVEDVNKTLIVQKGAWQLPSSIHLWWTIVTFSCVWAAWRISKMTSKTGQLPDLLAELAPRASAIDATQVHAPQVQTNLDEVAAGTNTRSTSGEVKEVTTVESQPHSRAQSSVSIVPLTPRGRAESNTESKENVPPSDESDNEETLDQEVEPALEKRKKSKTKRGVRGGRKPKKAYADGTNFEAKPQLTQEKILLDGQIQVGVLTYDARIENCLGQGSSGTAVFPGTLKGMPVAVKRLVKSGNSLAEKEIKHLVSNETHPNVIRYLCNEESMSFFYIALEKFETSLDQFVEFPEKFPGLVSPTRGYDVKDALKQVTRGVQHIHSLKLVHRDIKPQNILVRSVRTARPLRENQTQPLLFVISDFGLCKPLEDGPESVFAATKTAAGTTGWKAPELLVSSKDVIAAPAVADSTSSMSTRSATASSEGVTVDLPSGGRRATKAIDIFALGCVFFYVMTRGGHPFDKGSQLARDLNIKEDNYDTSLLRDSFLSYDYDADDLIMQMIMHNPKNRPDTTGILGHPYFWRASEKLEFLCLVSDNYEERKQKITNIHDDKAVRTPAEQAILDELAALQTKAEFVISRRRDGSLDFLSALPKSFLNEMTRQRKYTGSKMIDLLRVIRNKKNHFHDLPLEVREMMLKDAAGQIEGYYNFWRERFPALLVNCHQLVQERNLIEEFGLEDYYFGGLAGQHN